MGGEEGPCWVTTKGWGGTGVLIYSTPAAFHISIAGTGLRDGMEGRDTWALALGRAQSREAA